MADESQEARFLIGSGDPEEWLASVEQREAEEQQAAAVEHDDDED
jgi:hypothetical protein